MNLNRVQRVTDRIPVRTALVSTADKTGLAETMERLWEIVPDLRVFSTGGTYRLVMETAQRMEKAAHVVAVPDYTGQPEMQGGLVKSLDFKIYLGLLSEEFNTDHQADLKRTAAVSFDLTICNFYPFEAAAGDASASVEDLRTHIDIGGPSMLRASAKNFLRVAAVCRPDDYPALIQEMDTHEGATTLAWRAAAAAAAFRYTAHYETAIAGALGSRLRSADLAAIYDLDEQRT